MRSFQTITEALEAKGRKVKRSGASKAIAQCPAHDDGRPSLSISHTDGKTLLKCFAGCSTIDIVLALDLTLSDLWDEHESFTGLESMTGYQLLISNMPSIEPEPVTMTAETVPQTPIEYIYHDAEWNIIGKKTRLIDADGRKTFRQHRYDNGQWLPGLQGIDLPLYNLPLVQAAKGSETIWVVEGEKDADTLTNLGEIATTMPNGAGSWNERYTAQLAGAHRVNIIADNDEPGLKHATNVLQALTDADIDTTLYLPSDGYKDVTDMIHGGRRLADLVNPDDRIRELEQQQYEKQLARAVAEETLRLTARDKAKKHINDSNAANRYALPEYAATLTEELAKPDEATTYIIDQLWPVGANISLTATYKAGKTSTINNIVKALADHEPLFGHFKTNHTGRIAIWNYEVSANQIRRWIREVGIRNTDNISLLNMRGHTWPMVSDYVIEHTTKWLKENDIETWVVDPLARAFVGSGDENSNQDVGIFLDTLDYIKDQAGVANLLIAAHTGRNAEQGNSRARGASRFDDWVDARWMLVKDTDGQRWFAADGRDVTIDESRLDYDEKTRRQIIHINIDRKQSTQNDIDDKVYRIIAAAGLDGANQSAIARTYKAAHGSESLSSDPEPLHRLKDLGLIYCVKQGNSKVWKVTSHDLNAT